MTHIESSSIWIAAFGVFALVALVAHIAMCRKRLFQWAEDEGLTILEWKPMNKPVAYVTVQDKEKNVFSGWVHVGGLLAAFSRKKCEVEWDERPNYLRR